MRHLRAETEEDGDVLALIDVHFRYHAHPDELRANHRVENFTILEEIDSGGMGTVYRARQDDVGREVALKLIRGGPTSGDKVARFASEVGALARLNHPHIAQIYVSGTYQDGSEARPYFAMEYVPQAKSVTEYVEAKRLSLPERLVLFEKICGAVVYLHQRGIIHRDLKPANILVGESGHPKIIDLGVARAMEPGAHAQNAPAEVGYFAGSLPWASPEQVRRFADKIDTRTDVYSLGAVLYELLARVRPFQCAPGTCGDRAALEDLIVTKMPLPPSEAVMQAATSSTSTEVGDLLRINTAARHRALQEDLDYVVLKCLAKEPHQRYPGVRELRSDIGRCLSNELLPNRAYSLLDQARRFVRRNRGLVASAAILCLMILAGVVVSTTLLVAKARAQQEAVAKRDLVKRILQTVFETTDPYAPRPSHQIVRDLLDEAAVHVDTDFRDQPHIEADLRDGLGMAYARVGEYQQAEQHLREALRLRRQLYDADHVDVATTLEHLSLHLAWYRLNGMPPCDSNTLEEQIRWCEEAIDIRRRIQGADHDCTIRAIAYLAHLHLMAGNLSDFDRIGIESVLAGAKTPLARQMSPQIVTSATLLMGELMIAGHSGIATDFLKDVIQSASTDVPSVEKTLQLMEAGLDVLRHLWEAGDRALARKFTRCFYGPALEDEFWGDRIPAKLIVFAEGRMLEEDYSAAEPILIEAHGLARTLFGDDDYLLTWALDDLARLRAAQGRSAEAQAGFTDVLDRLRRSLGYNHPHVACALERLASAEMQSGGLEEAELNLRECLRVRSLILGEHWLVDHTQNVLAGCLLQMGRFQEAEDLLVPAYERIRAERGNRDSLAQEILERIILLYESWNKPAEAAHYRVILAARP